MSSDVISELSAIVDPEERARQCALFDILPSGPRETELLESCGDGEGFYQALVRARLNPQKENRVQWPKPAKRQKRPRRKDDTPSLFELFGE
jgi:hypothetical protein